MNAPQGVDVLAANLRSVIVKARNGDCTILDYYRDDEVHSDGPYSLAVASYLRPGAEIREVSDSTRVRYGRPTEDMLDRAGAH